MKIVGISGSIVGSKTRTAVEQVLNKINTQFNEVETELVDLGDYELVFSDGRDYRDYAGDTKDVLETIMSADAYIIGTPTYQASIPGTLKNLFDLLPNSSFSDKVIGLVSTAGSAKHYLVAEQQLKPILHYMGATVVPKYVFIEEKHYYNKKIVNDDVIFRMERLAEDIVFNAEVLQKVKEVRNSAYPF